MREDGWTFLLKREKPWWETASRRLSPPTQQHRLRRTRTTTGRTEWTDGLRTATNGRDGRTEEEEDDDGDGSDRRTEDDETDERAGRTRESASKVPPSTDTNTRHTHTHTNTMI